MTTTRKKYLLFTEDGGNSGYGTGYCSDNLGTSISFGTPVVFKSDRVEQNDFVYDSSAQKHAIF